MCGKPYIGLSKNCGEKGIRILDRIYCLGHTKGPTLGPFLPVD
jgi:hypothetical protein